MTARGSAFRETFSAEIENESQIMNAGNVAKDFKSSLSLGKILAGVVIVAIAGVVWHLLRRVKAIDTALSKVPGNATTGV